MKNYLKFIIAVLGVTMAMFASVDVKAKQKDKDPSGTCTLNMQICGRTGDGNVINGTYNE